MNGRNKIQAHGRIYHVSIHSVNRMLRALKNRHIDLCAYNGKYGFSLITIIPVSYHNFSDWHITISG